MNGNDILVFKLAYAGNASDKKQAIYDILNIKDFRKFYERSRIDEVFEK